MKTYDIAVIGAGPAGMTAAIYARRAGKSVALFEKNYPGGQMVSAHEIENYPAEGKISGFDLAEKMFAQTTEAGADYIGEEVTALEPGSPLRLKTPQGEYLARAVIIATGTVRSRLNIPGEERLNGRGVSWCATCDGAFYRGREVAVIGGGNSALSEALYLSSLCKSVHLVHRRDQYRAESSLVERVRAADNITEHLCALPVSIDGEEKVTSLTLEQNGRRLRLDVDAVFISVGGKPEQNLIAGVEKDANGYVKTDEQMRTSLPGVYAAGDNNSKQIRQIVTACADGAIAALNAGSAL